MNRHAPGVTFWTQDRLQRLYEGWKQRFGSRTPSTAERKDFERTWADQMTTALGRVVTPEGVYNQLRWGLTTQRRVTRNQFWAFTSNKSARLHARARQGPPFNGEWPEALFVAYTQAEARAVDRLLARMRKKK